MKGIIISASLWIVLMVMIVAMMWVFNFEHTRNQVVKAHKQSLRSTMIMCSEIQCNSEMAMDLFTQYFEPSISQYKSATWSLMGFHNEPLLIRVSVNVLNNNSTYPINIISDETIIQEINYE